MSIFGSIVSKIFGHAAAAPAPAQPGSSSSGSVSSSSPASFNNPAATQPAPGASTTQSAPQPGAAPSPSAPSASPSGQSVDVSAVLDGLAANHSEKLDWKRSIVDLMKLLGLDSSLSARQELAKELNYSGSTSDSAAMNIWLHKQVMQKLAANGGKVPDDLK